MSSPRGFETSSYFVEGPSGLVMIDTQFMPSATTEAVNWAEKATGKKVALAIVLHPNPDKFNGTATLQARGVKVVTAAQVLVEIPAVHELRTRWFYDRYKPDYPVEVPAPESFGTATTTLSAGGIEVVAHVMARPGCSPSHVVVTVGPHLFVGDLVSNGNHAWLELGLVDAWLARLDELDALVAQGASQVHPGRGASGGPELIAKQREYLEFVARAVGQEIANDHAWSDEVETRLVKSVVDRYPGYGYAHFVELGIPAVWRVASQQQP